MPFWKNTQDVKGPLIPILQEVQNLYNYLPKDVLEYIADKTGTPISEIYGVVTFYSLFHLNPRGRNVIRVCQGTACHVRGGKINSAGFGKCSWVLRPDIRLMTCALLWKTVACIGACGLAPVMQINDDTHGRLTTDKLAGILARYK